MEEGCDVTQVRKVFTHCWFILFGYFSKTDTILSSSNFQLLTKNNLIVILTQG